MNVKPPSERVKSLRGSAIREIMMLAEGRSEVIHLEVGQPDFSTPDHVIESAFVAARQGWTRYAPINGIASLRCLIADRVSGKSGAVINPDQVVVTVGAVGALYTAMAVLLAPGEEVLTPDPGWPNYDSIIRLTGGTPVPYLLPAERGFLPSLTEIEEAVTPRTKAIIINSPGNPTGAVYPREIVLGISEIAQRHGLYVVSDEIYEDIVFEGEHVCALSPGMEDRVFVISGVSKSYAMTGWRLGYVVSPPALSSLAIKLQESLTSGASSISQKAAEAALAGPQGFVQEAREAYMRRRDILLDIFGNTGLLPNVPAGAFYGLIRIGETEDSVSFAKSLLTSCNVATVPGVTFGDSTSRMIRVALAVKDEDLRAGLVRIREYIEK